MLLLPILGGVYVFRLASLIADWRYSKLKKSSRHQRYGMAPYRRWAILPLCAALVLSTGLYNWPLAIRFGLSRRLLEAEVSQLRRAPGTLGKFPRLVGLYRVEKLSLTGDGSVFFVTGYDVIDAVGFLYAPFPGRNQEHIVGNWYSYTDD
jgi:hypothetical protein